MEYALINVYPENEPETAIEKLTFAGDGAHLVSYRYWKYLWEEKYIGRVVVARCGRDFKDNSYGDIVLKKN